MKYMNNFIIPLFCCLVLMTIFVLLTSCSEPTNNVGTNSETPSTTLAITVTTNTQTFLVPEWVSDYQSIIEEYQKFAVCIIDDNLEIALQNNIFSAPAEMLEYNWDCMLVEANIWSYRDFPKAREAFGYGLKDLNGDGKDELILLLQDYTILSIFSEENSKPKLMDAYWPRHRCAILNSGLLYTLSSSGAIDWYYEIQKIAQDGSGLLQVERYGSTGDKGKPSYYKVIDGVTRTISEADLAEFNKSYPKLDNVTANEITRNSGIEFIPLFS